MNKGHFDAIKITLASPEDILRWSHGEVTKPETINYRTQRPEKDGLFSERIFGPTKDWECYCGKYRRARYKGVVCDKCGVEVTRSIVRRERLGHITLAAPVAHIWFFKNVPSKIGLFLNIPLAKLERVIYYAAYVVTAVHEENRKRALQDLDKEYKTRKKTIEDEGATVEDLESAMKEIKDILESLAIGNVLSESQYYNIAKRFGDVFEAGSGAEAIRKILSEVNLEEMIVELEKSLEHIKDSLKESRILRRIKLAKSFLVNNMRPEWMVMTVLPVLPPDLRPMVALDGGRYATSDLNDLYRRVINRNNRLKKLMELKAPEVIVTNEKRMLQEAVDALVDNTARLGSQQLSSQRRPLRSLSDMLKGKQGRFRQNLLGKRVDYSGRSVIVVGPHLKLGECGLPKKMALELFKPFVIHKIIERGLAHNIRNSNRLIEQAPPEVWEILEEVIENRHVLLNRAPTLHRLGVQAFKPRLTEDLAIQIPPLVCTAFNADFDGDQMAVHLPLSHEAQEEARTLMLASQNLLKPATGDPIVSPTQDVILGVYYLTNALDGAKSQISIFTSKEDAVYAYENDLAPINALIKIRESHDETLETTVGRIIFNRVLPEGFEYVNKLVTKKDLSKIVGRIITQYGIDVARKHLDSIKEVGFTYATKSGVSWGMDDLRVPPEKKAVLKEAEMAASKVREQYEEGLLTNAERRERVIEIWKKTNDKIGKEIVPRTLDTHSSVHSIIASGARGSWSQPAQMMGMKGLVQNNQGETIELPVKSSYKEGFNVLEYFISTHGSRKGLTDTALKTAQAGYLTRRLVDVAQDLIIREEDCKTKEGIDVVRAEGLEFGYAFGNKVFSRTAVEDVKVGNKIFVKAGEMIDRKMADAIDAEQKIETIKLRSPITCKTLYGVCSKCYGYDLGTNQPIRIGEAVGVVAAQSIGEPGTQLTMRTFHIGGVAGADITHGLPRVEEVFEVRTPKGKAFLVEADGEVVEIEEKGLIKYVRVQPEGKQQKKLLEYPVPRSSWLNVKVGDSVKKGDALSHGPSDLREIFKLKGGREVERMILHEIQKIYLSEGAVISNKHIEVIVRQMFSRVKIVETGDTHFVRGDVVEKSVFLEVNRNAKKEGGAPAKAQQLLLGITKVALSTESFLSAASFMETARVLINASVEARIDKLRGLKESVIIGRLIPAGTGYMAKLKDDDEEPASDTVLEAEQATS